MRARIQRYKLVRCWGTRVSKPCWYPPRLWGEAPGWRGSGCGRGSAQLPAAHLARLAAASISWLWWPMASPVVSRPNTRKGCAGARAVGGAPQ